MQTTLKLLCGLMFILGANRAFSQSMSEFLSTKGVKDLCEAAHPANTFQKGSYYVAYEYVNVSFVSEDFVGVNRYTDLQLARGHGDLAFTELIILRDTDPFKTFDVFKTQAQLLMLTYKGLVGEDMFNRVVDALQLLSNTRVADWDGATWALLAINFSYYSYLLTGE